MDTNIIYKNIVSFEFDAQNKKILEDLYRSDPSLFSQEVLKALQYLYNYTTITAKSFSKLAPLGRIELFNNLTSTANKRVLQVYLTSIANKYQLNATKLFKLVEKLILLQLDLDDNITYTNKVKVIVSNNLNFSDVNYKNPIELKAQQNKQLELLATVRPESATAIDIFNNIKSYTLPFPLVTEIVSNIVKLHEIIVSSGNTFGCKINQYLDINLENGRVTNNSTDDTNSSGAISKRPRFD